MGQTSARPAGLPDQAPSPSCPAGPGLSTQGTLGSLVKKVGWGLQAPRVGCTQWRVLFGCLIPATWPREGHLAGPQISPLQEEAPQATAVSKSTLGWAGVPQASLTPPCRTWHWGCGVGRGPYLRGGAERPTVRGPLLPGPARGPSQGLMQTAALFSSGGPLLLSPGPRYLSAERGGVPHGEGGPALAHTHTQPSGEGSTSSGVCCQTRWGDFSCW